MRALARVLRRLADHIDPPKPHAVNINVHGNPAEIGRSVEKALLALTRQQGRPLRFD